MSLSRGQVNPLSVLGFRKLSFIPEHFAKISIEPNLDIKKIEQWIEYNLNSRYAIKAGFILNSNKKVISVLQIGFEDPRELTIMSLGCQHLHKKG
jgi:hypothetical protein